MRMEAASAATEISLVSLNAPKLEVRRLASVTSDIFSKSLFPVERATEPIACGFAHASLGPVANDLRLGAE